MVITVVIPFTIVQPAPQMLSMKTQMVFYEACGEVVVINVVIPFTIVQLAPQMLSMKTQMVFYEA